MLNGPLYFGLLGSCYIAWKSTDLSTGGFIKKILHFAYSHNLFFISVYIEKSGYICPSDLNDLRNQQQIELTRRKRAASVKGNSIFTPLIYYVFSI